MMMIMAMMVMMLVVPLSQCPIGFQLCPHIDDDDYGHDGDDAGGYIILVPYWISTVPAH